VELDEPPHERQSEAEAPTRAVERLRLLHEQIEDALQQVGADALAGIPHAQHGVAVGPLDDHPHLAAAGVYLSALPNQESADRTLAAWRSTRVSPRLTSPPGVHPRARMLSAHRKSRTASPYEGLGAAGRGRIAMV
jgi:hypothetical protein